MGHICVFIGDDNKVSDPPIADTAVAAVSSNAWDGDWNLDDVPQTFARPESFVRTPQALSVTEPSSSAIVMVFDVNEGEKNISMSLSNSCLGARGTYEHGEEEDLYDTLALTAFYFEVVPDPPSTGSRTRSEGAKAT